MGKIKKILEKELGSTQSVEVYPVTSIEAVYDENNERLDNIINRKNKEIQKELEAEVTRASNAESNLRETINNITEINENATSANIVTIDNIPNTSASNVQQALNELFKNATFAGIATPTTNPGTPDGPVFYIATKAGTYANFSGIEIVEGETVILKWDNGTWTKTISELATNKETIYDVSARNNRAVFESLSALLSSSNLSTLIPTSVRHGGMSIQFIQGSVLSSDNKYVQYRLIADEWSVNPYDWSSDFSIQKNNLYDFSIKDNKGNNIVIFKKGHIFTKNFDSTKIQFNLENQDYQDFSIADNKGNNIVIFRKGHIFTKNFDSSAITSKIEQLVSDIYEKDKKEQYLLLPKCPLFNYSFETEINSDFIPNNNWSVVDGRLISTSAGINNRLIHNKYVSISQKYTYCRFTVHSDTYFGVGWLSSAYSFDGSLFTIDAANGKLNIHQAWSNGNTVPSVKYTLSYTFVDGRDYLIKIKKDRHTNYVSIIDCLTGEESQTIQSIQTSTNGLDEFSGGRQMDRLQLVHLSGTSPNIQYIRCCASYKEPLVVVYGDSITEGDRVYNGQTYVDLMKEALGEERVICSGLSGSQISGLITKMQFELPLLKPKFVMVSIGTNGGNTQELFNQAKQVIEENGAIPIINVPPMGYSDLETLRTYIFNLGVTTTRFDIATSVNNDISQGKNTKLFADGIHPNKLGHIAMFNRLKSDCNILFNY